MQTSQNNKAFDEFTELPVVGFLFMSNRLRVFDNISFTLQKSFDFQYDKIAIEEYV